MGERIVGSGIEIQSTLKAVHVAADLVLEYKKISEQAIKQYPYLPSPLKLALAGERYTDFRELTPEQRLRINAGEEVLYSIMERRADLQAKWAEHPDMVKQNILTNIDRDTEHMVELDPKGVDIGWSFFSFALVLREREYRSLSRAINATDYNLNLGYVTPNFALEDGTRVPLIRKSSSAPKDHLHEDVHVLLDAIGETNFPYNPKSVFNANPNIQRAFLDEGIQPEDLEECRNFFSGVCKFGEANINEEIRPRLWDRLLPSKNETLLWSYTKNWLEAAQIAVLNSAFHASSRLSDEEKVREVYETMLRIGELHLHQETLMAILNQAADSYKGKYNSWDWVASRMLVLPTSSSLSLAKATLLGRGTKLADEPKLDTVLPLPQALITYVRKTVNPNSYGQGEQIRPENIAAYLDLCVNTFQNRSLYGTICEDNGIKDANFARIRSLFIKYATKSAAAGFRGKVERDLTKRIGA